MEGRGWEGGEMAMVTGKEGDKERKEAHERAFL